MIQYNIKRRFCQYITQYGRDFVNYDSNSTLYTMPNYKISFVGSKAELLWLLDLIDNDVVAVGYSNKYADVKLIDGSVVQWYYYN